MTMQVNIWRQAMAVVCAAQLAIAPVIAQGQAQGAQETPALRVTTRLIQLNVVVLDKNGHPVTGLKKEDFTIVDEGKEQPIGVFNVENAMAAQAVQPKALPPNTVTNRVEAISTLSSPNVTVILFDSLNTEFADQAYARDQVVKYLRQLQAGDRVAIYALTKNLTVLHDFTSSLEPLLRALNSYQGDTSMALAATQIEKPDIRVEQGSPETDAAVKFVQFVESAQQRLSDYQTVNRAQTTLRALEAIANHVRALPGRKTLVWVSGSFPFTIGLETTELGKYSSQERRTLAPEIERMSQAVNDANLAVYPVDARGLSTQIKTKTLVDPRADRRPGCPPAEYGPCGSVSDIVKNSIDFENTLGTMKVIADRTGGKAFFNTNDVEGSVRRAIDESRVTYVLGYYPTHGKWDGKYHEIKVKVNRPGVDIRYRRGYFARADQKLDKNQRITVLREAVASPIDAVGVGLTARLGPTKGTTRNVQVLIEARDLTLVEQQGNWAGVFDLLLVQRSGEGQNVDTFAHTQDLNLSKAQYDQVLKEGIVLGLDIDMKPEGQTLRVVVRDATSGAIGTVSLPVK